MYLLYPKAAWLGKHPTVCHKSVHEQRLIYWGSTIYNMASTSRAFIISKLNPHWVDACDLPSGHTRSDHLRALLDALWPMDC
jgi:hypothetical protein